MRKINATLIDGEKKENVIFKIKDDSFTIVTSNNELIKIPYTSVKDYTYADKAELLTIYKFGGASVNIGIEKDKQLLMLLKDISNKNDSSKSIPMEEIEEKNLNNLNTQDINKSSAPITQSAQNDKKEPTTLDGIIGIIAVIIIIGIGISIFKGLFPSDTKGIKGDVLGTYYIGNTQTTVKLKEKTMVDGSNEEKILYEIKVVNRKSDGNYNFDMYDNGTKKAECTTTFGMISCSTSNGGFIIFTKK